MCAVVTGEAVSMVHHVPYSEAPHSERTRVPSAEKCGENGHELVEFLDACFDANGGPLPVLGDLPFVRQQRNYTTT